MNTARVSLGLAILLAWTCPLLAQQPTTPTAPPAVRTVNGSYPEDDAPDADDMHTQSLFDNRNYMIRSDAGDSVGYLRGFQTFAAFQPLMIDDNLIAWFSPRGYVTYNAGTFGGNLGAGARWLDPSTDRILGGGFWWDHDNNGVRQFDQLGGSIESLGNYLDFRANGYWPTNQNVQQTGQFFNNQDVFIGHNIGIGRTTVNNSALKGGDFETGGALPGIGGFGARTYVGGYYYQGPLSGGAIYGVRARLEALITQNIWGTVIWTHDRVFGTTVSAAATFYLGTGDEPRWFQRIPMQTRLFQQMERQYRVAVQQEVHNEFLLALRAGGTGGSGGPVGTPIFVEHVDNTAPAGGDGSVEHPLNHLPTTTPSNVDIIFVHRGTGTSFNMNQGTTLNNFERLLGEGAVHFFNSTQGTFLLPGFTPGPFPSITNINPGGSAVTLASHNEVSGFNINAPALHGITGTNITDFNINNVNITNAGNNLGPVPVGAGIQLTNAGGIGTIFNSTFVSNHAEGIRIDNSDGSLLNLTVTNVTANQNLTGISLNANAGSEIDTTLTNITANSNTKDGIDFSNLDGVLNATLVSSRVRNNGGFGISAIGQGEGTAASILNVTIGGLPATARGNIITGNHGAGIEFELLDQATGTVNILGNTIQGNLAANPVSTTFLGQGIDIRLTGTTIASNATASLTAGVIDGNTIGSLTNSALGNAGPGIRIFADQSTSIENVQIGELGTGNGNIIANNAGDGIFITRANTATVGDVTPISMANNNITLNTGNGVHIEALGSFGGVVNGFAIANSQITHNTQDGILLHVEADAQMDVDIHANTISNNARAGIETTELVGAPGDLRGIGGVWDMNTITQNGTDGIHLNAASGTALENLLIGSLFSSADGNTITNNGGHGILDNSAGNVEVSFNLIDSNPLGGIYINALPALDFTIDHNVISNNGNASVTATDGGDGIQVVGSQLVGSYVVTITNNTIRTNVGRGINVLNRVNGTTTVDIENNTIDTNGQEGIYVVNTASGAQSADALASAAMDATGSPGTRPRLFLTVNNNDVEGNGINTASPGAGLSVTSGLVVRVGTSDGNFNDPTGNDGGFFGDGRGGIGASVTNNFFHGNLGNDISFSSFTSTGNPVATSGGTWSATVFTPPTTYGTDPLARLDLSFHNNTFDSTGSNVGNIDTGNRGVSGAFYNDGDGTFKSRLNNATPPGPFTSATRERNAERLAGRFLGSLPPFTPQLGNFLYPGMGQSTFRLLDSSNGGQTTAADVAAAGFITDIAPYTTPFDASGSLRPGVSEFDNMPFGWTFLNGVAPPARPQ